MKWKTFMWETLFSVIFLLLLLKICFKSSIFFEISLLAVISFGILIFSKQKDNLILIHNALNLLLITIVFLTGLRGVDVTLAFLIAILGIIFTSISLEMQDREEQLKKLDSYIEKSEKKNDVKKQTKVAKPAKKKEEPKKEQKPRKEKTKTRYVAGKFSNQYHVEDCPVAKRLVKKRYYESKERAEFAGLKPHNCVK